MSGITDRERIRRENIKTLGWKGVMLFKFIRGIMLVFGYSNKDIDAKFKEVLSMTPEELRKENLRAMKEEVEREERTSPKIP